MSALTGISSDPLVSVVEWAFKGFYIIGENYVERVCTFESINTP